MAFLCQLHSQGGCGVAEIPPTALGFHPSQFSNPQKQGNTSFPKSGLALIGPASVMCLSSNRSLWPGSQSSWNWEGWSAYHTIARRLRVGELWSLEGKAGSVPKKECWAAQDTGAGMVAETGSWYLPGPWGSRWRGKTLRNCCV